MNIQIAISFFARRAIFSRFLHSLAGAVAIVYDGGGLGKGKSPEDGGRRAEDRKQEAEERSHKSYEKR